MRKPLLFCVLALGLGLWGCGDREHEGGVAVVKPPVHTGELQAGEFHNDVMAAFEERAPLQAIPSMQWDEWMETTLNSMEEVCAARDIPFDRAETSRHIVQLVKVFGALEEATGIEPGMLRASPSPETDLNRLVTQLESWKLIDRKTAATLSEFRADDAAGARAESVTDAALRDLFRIGASSREFWLIHERNTRSRPLASPDDGGIPCKKCNAGATISDFLGGIIGRIICGGSRTCPMMMAAAASLLYNMGSGYCNDHPCGFQNWFPPVLP